MGRVTGLAALTNLAISGLMAVLVLYALDVLRVPEEAYGVFLAGVVLGGLAGALGAGRLAARYGTLPVLRLVLAGQALALVGLAGRAYGVAPVGWAAAATFALATVLGWRALRPAAGVRSGRVSC
ncbi:hypothetical protein [Micromonospora sp. NPDC048830]|uniref:hypothetical protein n=1 Tax=Micromonospora sp. NPDC048830 TaxID=3364257 RepID=UPI00371CB27B